MSKQLKYSDDPDVGGGVHVEGRGLALIQELFERLELADAPGEPRTALCGIGANFPRPIEPYGGFYHLDLRASKSHGFDQGYARNVRLQYCGRFGG